MIYISLNIKYLQLFAGMDSEDLLSWE